MNTKPTKADLKDIESFLNLMLSKDKQALTNFISTKPLIYKQITDIIQFAQRFGEYDNSEAFIKENSEFFSLNIEIFTLVFQYILNNSAKSDKQTSQETKTLLNKTKNDIDALVETIQDSPFSQNSDFIGLALTLSSASEYIKSYYEHGKLTLDKSIVEYEKLLKHKEFNSSTPKLRIHIFYDAGIGYFTRYKNQGNLPDLDIAISLLEKAHFISSEENQFPNLFHDLGIALREKCNYTENNTEELLRALKLIEKASQMLEVSPEMKELYISNMLEIAFSYPHFYTDEQLCSFIHLYEFMLSILGKKIKAHSLNILARGYFIAFQRIKDKTQIDKSIATFREAIDASDSNNPILSNYINNLAASFHARYEVFDDKNDLDNAILYYQKSLETGFLRGLQISTALKSSRGFFHLAFLHREYTVCKDAFYYFNQAADFLVKSQLQRHQKESWLKESQGIFSKTAYAFAKLGKPKEATEALEQGQARLLSESLALSRVNLTALQNTENEHLCNAYHDIAQCWLWAQQYKSEALQEIRNQLDEVIKKIRQLEGYTNFLMPISWESIKLAAENTPLLYLLATEHGGLALLVQCGEVKSIWLPNFTEAILHELLETHLTPYQDWKEATQNNNYFNNWCKALEFVTYRLWEYIFAPLHKDLPKKIILIPSGLLNLLPLHLAWTQKGDKKHYILDDFVINYAPNALSLETAKKRPSLKPDKLLIIDDPFNKLKRLDYANIEATTIAKHFNQNKVFSQHEAVLENVKNELEKDYNVLHFSCHGLSNLRNPLETGLCMVDYSNDDKDCSHKLTVQDFLNAKLNARLVTLSACETGMIGIKLPEEVVNLPASLLQAGVAGVVASLWAVNDFSTALLMIKFYENFAQQSDNIALSLQQAQHWLRDSTNKDFLKYIEDHQLSLDATQKRHFRKNNPQDKPFQHCYYWGAFYVTGV
jgi:CHAT domain-containing protein/tetratricopeptide (TPR) repeat protein